VKLRVSYLLAVIALSFSCWWVSILLWGSQGLILTAFRLLLLGIISLLMVAALVQAAVKLTPKIWIAAGIFILICCSYQPLLSLRSSLCEGMSLLT